MHAGSKILVVEDNYLFAQVICDFVVDCGMEAIGPACGLETGLVYAREAPIDGAILDINLDGRFSFPICVVLAQRGIPFCFLTGYSDLALVPQQFRSLPLVSKPFEPKEMQDAIEMMLSGQPGGPLARAASSTVRSRVAS
jgi:DNA-binding response OmpR family regulator